MIVIQGQGGIMPAVTPDLLPETAAQAANNTRLFNGGVQSLRAPVTIATPTKGGAGKTIYRFGANTGNEAQYWFKFSTIANICRGPIAGDTEERTYFSGDGTPKKTKFDLATGSGTDYPMVSYELGVPAPTTAPVLTGVAGVGPTVAEQRAYVYTHVTAWGEESAPSPAAIGPANATTLQQLSGFDTLPTGQYNLGGAGSARRIYRTVTAASGTNYYHIADIPTSSTTFLDDVAITAIGEPLATLDWDAPPDDLAGLVALPSGALCGFVGKDIYFSVIGAPYAWPQKYILTAEYDVVAVAPMGQGVAVLTKGFPYFINTGDPEAAQMIRLDDEQACVSARSVVSLGGTVAYASPDGLVGLTPAGATLLTAGRFDRDKWQALLPDTIFAAKHDSRYYGFFDGGGGFVIEKNGDFTTHDVNATACYVDPVLDALYVMFGAFVQRWDRGAAKLHTWKSKRFNLGQPSGFSAAKIKANSFTNLTFNLYGDGALVFSQAVTSSAPFRLPDGLHQLWEIEIVGTDHWTVCAIGAMEELKGV